MVIRKIHYRLSQVYKFILRRFGRLEINWGYWIFSFICLASIIMLGMNIFRIIRKGYERYEIILNEKQRLEDLIAKNEELREDLKYYSSKEYVDIKAREELNLAFPNQRLVYIDREQYINIKEESRGEQELAPSWRLWYDLIF